MASAKVCQPQSGIGCSPTSSTGWCSFPDSSPGEENRAAYPLRRRYEQTRQFLCVHCQPRQFLVTSDRSASIAASSMILLASIGVPFSNSETAPAAAAQTREHFLPNCGHLGRLLDDGRPSLLPDSPAVAAFALPICVQLLRCTRPKPTTSSGSKLIHVCPLLFVFEHALHSQQRMSGQVYRQVEFVARLLECGSYSVPAAARL